MGQAEYKTIQQTTEGWTDGKRNYGNELEAALAELREQGWRRVDDRLTMPPSVVRLYRPFNDGKIRAGRDVHFYGDD